MTVIINGTNTPTAGGVTYGNGTEYATTSAGTTGQVLTSAGASAPTWSSVSSLTTAPTLQTFTYVAKTGTFSRGTTLSGTYSQTSTTVTVTITNHGLATGDRVWLDFTSGTATDAWFTVTVTNSSTFTVTRGSATTSGNVTLYPPIVISVTDNGQVTSGNCYVTFSATFTTGSVNVYQATTNTFQADITGNGTTGAGSSGTVTLNLVAASQTWTKPTGCKKVLIELCGGGGAGTVSSSALGQGGGYARELLDVSAIGTATVTVGTGGRSVATTGATTGGTTSFGAYVSATGGSESSPGAGSGGDLNLNGTYSVGGVSLPAGSGSVGGACLLGSGGLYISGCSPTFSSGVGYGWASIGSSISTTKAGDGVVFVTEYY